MDKLLDDDEDMTPEIETYARELRWLLGQFVVSLEGLTEEQLDRKPSSGGANCVHTIVNHLVGSTRVYVLGFGCGRQVTRNRDAEFAAPTASARQLVLKVQQLSDEVQAALKQLQPSLLDRRTLPSKELWGTGQPREISGRQAIVEAIRHAAIHLGELRLTRDLALR